MSEDEPQIAVSVPSSGGKFAPQPWPPPWFGAITSDRQPTVSITRQQLADALEAEWDSSYAGPRELAVNVYLRLTADQKRT
jgi:hypothetical protein